MSNSPASSSASDKTLTPRSSPAPPLTRSAYNKRATSPSVAGGMATSLAPSHQHQSVNFPSSSSSSPPSSSSPSSVRFRAQNAQGNSSSSSSPSMAQCSSDLGSPSAASSSSSNRNILNPASTSTATMTNPVMAAMSSGGASLIPRNPSGSSYKANGSGGDRPGSHRKRSSSIVTVQKIEQSQEELLDQAAGFNANADWVNHKGAWVIHVVLILLGKILLDVVPGMRQDASWTIVNLGYIAISYLMFHHVTGTPFESNGGAYDQLTLWEQIDEGAQYTPAKKWLTSVPIGVFLISTHYTKYNLGLFALNFGATFFVLLPKLPLLHRLRFRLFSSGGPPGGISGTNSPYPSRPNTPAAPY